MNLSGKERLVCTARKPNTRFHAQLVRAMRELGASKEAKGCKSWEAHLTADLETTAQELARVLEEDWLENKKANLPCDYEYQVFRVAEPVDHLQVLTRLFRHGDSGSIYYGRSVARFGDDKFMFWLE